ncbi:MAG: hypothetical protein P8O70_20275 [SAR324 cluster bacterium]|nr:hypothetical protein [SAR324 cluster bacterium]
MDEASVTWCLGKLTIPVRDHPLRMIALEVVQSPRVVEHNQNRQDPPLKLRPVGRWRLGAGGGKMPEGTSRESWLQKSPMPRNTVVKSIGVS